VCVCVSVCWHVTKSNGHFNAQIDYMADGWEDVTGLEGSGHLMDIGERLLNLCAANGL